jgi:hypothetical protein
MFIAVWLASNGGIDRYTPCSWARERHRVNACAPDVRIKAGKHDFQSQKVIAQ